jgi:hypothetical protein
VHSNSSVDQPLLSIFPYFRGALYIFWPALHFVDVVNVHERALHAVIRLHSADGVHSTCMLELIRVQLCRVPSCCMSLHCIVTPTSTCYNFGIDVRVLLKIWRRVEYTICTSILLFGVDLICIMVSIHRRILASTFLRARFNTFGTCAYQYNDV